MAMFFIQDKDLDRMHQAIDLELTIRWYDGHSRSEREAGYKAK